MQSLEYRARVELSDVTCELSIQRRVMNMPSFLYQRCFRNRLDIQQAQLDLASHLLVLAKIAVAE